MKRAALCLLGVVVVGISTAWGPPLPAALAEKRPLDLPAGGSKGTAEEDYPELVHFLGGEYEGDGFFFLLDISGSMFGDRIARLKSELSSALLSLSPKSDFGIVAFSDWQRIFFHRPLRATKLQTARACAWVADLNALGSTRMLAGAQQILKIAHKSRKRLRVIIAVGDGLPTDPSADETLNAIIEANVRHIPWNTLLLGQGEHAAEFMSNLASITRGTFRQISL